MLAAIALAQEAASPAMVVTPEIAARAAVSFGCGAACLYFLATGRREGSVARMLWGVALAFAAMLVF